MSKTTTEFLNQVAVSGDVSQPAPSPSTSPSTSGASTPASPPLPTTGTDTQAAPVDKATTKPGEDSEKTILLEMRETGFTIQSSNPGTEIKAADASSSGGGALKFKRQIVTTTP